MRRSLLKSTKFSIMKTFNRQSICCMQSVTAGCTNSITCLSSYINLFLLFPTFVLMFSLLLWPRNHSCTNTINDLPNLNLEKMRRGETPGGAIVESEESLVYLMCVFYLMEKSLRPNVYIDWPLNWQESYSTLPAVELWNSNDGFKCSLSFLHEIEMTESLLWK